MIIFLQAHIDTVINLYIFNVTLNFDSSHLEAIFLFHY